MFRYCENKTKVLKQNSIFCTPQAAENELGESSKDLLKRGSSHELRANARWFALTHAQDPASVPVRADEAHPGVQ